MADLILSNGKNVVDILSQLKKIKELELSSIKNLNLLYLEGVILFYDSLDDVRL